MKPSHTFLLFIVTSCVCAASPAVAALLSNEEVAAKIEVLRQGINARTDAERAMDAQVRERYKDATVIDLLIPGTPAGYVEGTIADYEAMAELSRGSGFTAVSYTAAIDNTFEPLQILHWIAKARIYWDQTPDKYLMVDAVDDAIAFLPLSMAQAAASIDCRDGLNMEDDSPVCGIDEVTYKNL